jgi:hypothetical protein
VPSAGGNIKPYAVIVRIALAMPFYTEISGERKLIMASSETACCIIKEPCGYLETAFTIAALRKH